MVKVSIESKRAVRSIMVVEVADQIMAVSPAVAVVVGRTVCGPGEAVSRPVQAVVGTGETVTVMETFVTVSISLMMPVMAEVTVIDMVSVAVMVSACRVSVWSGRVSVHRPVGVVRAGVAGGQVLRPQGQGQGHQQGHQAVHHVQLETVISVLRS